VQQLPGAAAVLPLRARQRPGPGDDLDGGAPGLPFKLAHERLHGLPEDVQHKILRGNAERLYRFTPSAPPTGAG
jgi:hypothetical protein